MTTQAQPVTDFIEGTEDLLTETVNCLTAAAPDWRVEIFRGSSADQLFARLVDLRPPAAAVFYRNSDYQNRPRRTTRITIAVVAASPNDAEAQQTALDMACTAVAALDQHILNDALWRVRTDAAYDFGPELATIMVDFDVEDH